MTSSSKITVAVVLFHRSPAEAARYAAKRKEPVQWQTRSLPLPHPFSVPVRRYSAIYCGSVGTVWKQSTAIGVRTGYTLSSKYRFTILFLLFRQLLMLRNDMQSITAQAVAEDICYRWNTAYLQAHVSLCSVPLTAAVASCPQYLFWYSLHAPCPSGMPHAP